ncbi:hypothetical protein DFH11DRAFT_1749081 [Phellopilus nigrolimitatus]|nr:hypothetical protein DFH11DRAFT_1749081 [Phellopilus nigrolimitatus]
MSSPPPSLVLAATLPYERKAIGLAAHQQQQLQMQRQAVSSVPASDVLAHGFTHLNSAPFLSSALADADARCRELTVAQGRATRAEHLLASVQGLPSRASPDPNVDGEKVNGERERENDMKAEPKALESAAKVVLDAEARAERAERSHADLAESLQSLCAQFTKVERYEHAGSLVPPTRAPLLRPSSTASHAPIPVTRPPHLSRARIFSTNDDETLTLPSLPLPHAIGAPSSGSSMLTGPSTHPAPPASSTSLRAILPRSVSTSRLRRTLYSIWLPDTDTDKDWVTCGKAPNRARLSTRFRFPTAIRHEALDVRCGRHVREMQPQEQERPRAGGAA